MSDEPHTQHSSSDAARAPAHRYTAAFADSIERRWQAEWEARSAFRAHNPGDPGFDPKRPKFYALDMFPYPSGDGLHVGHPEGYTATDILSRYKRMTGFNVLHPMGWDAFGLPAEQYAVQTNVHPRETTKRAIDTFRRQLKRFGFSYDWEREFATIDPEYYRWTQWIWLRCYHAWYDPRANDGKGAARPIKTLLDALANEMILVAPNGDIVIADKASRDLSALEGGTAHGVLREWSELPEADRRAVVDNQRLAYLGDQLVNWCPKLGTVLANEEIIDGKSERGGHPVRRMPLKQWMFRITAFADRLLDDLALVDWPDSTRIQQAEWIGRSEGAEIEFPVLSESDEPTGETIRVFTTRPDTVFGASYMVLAPEHALVDDITTAGRRAEVAAYRERVSGLTDVERLEHKSKTGVFTGAHALNPASGERIPIWIADYVLTGYGTGAIMAVPAHDERDFEFAKAFNLPVKPVVKPESPDDGALWERVAKGEACFPGVGVAIESSNSEVSLNGLPTDEAKRVITEWLEESSSGSAKVNYKLRDWLFSRQRYWGEPFPVVFDAQGTPHALDESRLPVLLPEMENFKPTESDSDTPQPPLGRAKDWLSVEIDGTVYTRETNTMPNWAGSCWYYLRYCDAHNHERFVGRDAERFWIGGETPDGERAGEWGVDLYMGGSEHAVLHLLYARFWHKVLYDLGELSTPEPFRTLRHQGLIQSFAYQRPSGGLVPVDEVDEPRDGEFVERSTGEPCKQIVAKMSKSLKNVVNPDHVIGEFGADTFRLYEMYLGPIEASKPWNPRDIVGLYRFLQRAWRMVVDEETGAPRLTDARDEGTERALHKTIKKVGEDIERLSFNTAIAAMIEFVNAGTKTGVTVDQAERFALILCPFAPHIAEEIYARLHAGNEPGLASLAEWPDFDESMLASETVEVLVQVLGKPKDRMTVAPDADDKTLEAAALALPKVREAIAGKTVRKVIVVPGRLVNIVAN